MIMRKPMLLVLAVIVLIPAVALALTINTTDPTAIANFQNGATVITFEGIPGITAFNNQTPGTVVPANALLKNQIAGLTFFSNAAGGPAVLDLTGVVNITDAQSQPNILAGTFPDGNDAVICFECFIEVTFASPVSRVGAFNDPTGGTVLLLATDLSGGTVFESIQGTQGQFIGADTGTNDIERALFLFVSAQAVNGFSLDDLTFAQVNGTPVAEPTTLVLLGGGLFGLAWARRRLNRR
jgi:PEP-CTERM motif